MESWATGYVDLLAVKMNSELGCFYDWSINRLVEAEVVFFSSVAIDHVFGDQSGNFKYIVRNILYFHLLTCEDKLIFVDFGLSAEKESVKPYSL